MADAGPANFGSVYNNLQSGQVDPTKMLGLLSTINQLKDFQSRQAVGQAFQDATDPESGLTDTGKFMGLVKSNPDAALRAPEAGANAAALTGQYTANKASQFQLNAGQTKFLSDLAGSFVGKAGGATDRDVAVARTIAARNGIPLPLTEGILGQGANDSRTPQQRFQDLQDFAMGPQGRSAQAPTGIIPAGQPGAGTPVIGTAGQAMRAATTPQPGTVSPTGAPASPPGITTSLPPGSQGTMEQAANDSVKLLQSASNIPNQRAMLLNLQDLSDEAATGPQADFEKRANQLWQRVMPGSKLTLTPGQLSNTEEYAKIAENLVQQMAASGHTTDAFLHNAYGANPNLSLSKLGRQGITGWLLGNTDAQATVTNEWSKYIQAHPGAEGQYYNWLYGKGPDQFNITNFDPRVFQYERMNPDDQEKFQKMIKGKGELSKFVSNLRSYEAKGWVGGQQQ